MSKNFLKNKDKKAQQEIVGFTIIVLIVIVVGIVFLGIQFRSHPDSIETLDIELNNFLSSSSKYTTDCVLREPYYAELAEIVEGCYSGLSCSDGRMACGILEETYKGMLTSPNPLKAGEDRPIKYNKIRFYYQELLEDPSTKNQFYEVFLGSNSSCSLKTIGRNIRYSYPGNIVIELESCKSS